VVTKRASTKSAAAGRPPARKSSGARAPARKQASARDKLASHDVSAVRAAKTKPDAAARVLRRFRTVFNAVRSHFRTMEQSVGISGTEVWALSQIAANPGMGVGQLASAMDVHQSTASNLVRARLEAGMAVSERSEGDQRAVHLHATARGLKLLAKAPTPFVGVLPEALHRIDEATLLRLDRDLARVIRELRADEDGAQVIISSDEPSR
jgi:DNA-binding MarR family transcriptional regulator